MSIEIVTILINANPDLVNYVNNEEVNLLQCTIQQRRFDIVQVLIANGCPVNQIDLDGDTALHIAAVETHADIIRYLLYESDCDAGIRNERGMVACTILFCRLLNKLNQDSFLPTEELDCFVELASFTFDLVDMTKTHLDANRLAMIDLNEMIYLCYDLDQPRCCLYMAILKIFHVPPSKQYFVDRILQTDVRSCHCLITGLLLGNVYNAENLWQYDEITESIAKVNNQMRLLSVNFLLELYSLFLSDESFFREYIAEFMSTGWKFSEQYQGVSQIQPFYDYLMTNTKKKCEPQKMFTFMKTLIMYGIDFQIFVRNELIELMPCEVLPVFTSLVNLVSPETSLDSFSSFNDENQKQHLVTATNQVIPLKNLCRLSVRRYYFRCYSHYDALKRLYSLNVPSIIRQFLCHNFDNLNF